MSKRYSDTRAGAKSKARFKKKLTVYLVILSLLLCGVLAYLWFFLDNYQAKQDALAQEAAELSAQKAYEKAVYQAPQRCFEAFMDAADANYWADVWYNAHPESTDVREKVVSSFDSLFCGENTQCFKAADFDPAAPVYVIKNGEEQLASVRLGGSELNWSVQDVHIDLQAKEGASIEVPGGCTVYCNGVRLDPTIAADAHSYFEMAELESALVNPIEWSTYTVEGLLFPPELTAESPADKTLVFDEAGNMRYVLSADAAAQYQRQGEEMIKKLLFYYMQGGNNTATNMYAVLGLLVNGSQAYKLVADSYNGVTWDASYPGATYEATAAEVVIWADNCMSMDVKYHAEGVKGGYTNVADGTYVLYFMDNGNGYGICGLAYK